MQLQFQLLNLHNAMQCMESKVAESHSSYDIRNSTLVVSRTIPVMNSDMAVELELIDRLLCCAAYVMSSYIMLCIVMLLTAIVCNLYGFSLRF